MAATSFQLKPEFALDVLSADAEKILHHKKFLEELVIERIGQDDDAVLVIVDAPEKPGDERL